MSPRWEPNPDLRRGRSVIYQLHVHYPPNLALSTLGNTLKSVSSRRLRQELPAHVRRYLWGQHLWSPSYFAGSCGGAPLSIINEYIEQQKRPD